MKRFVAVLLVFAMIFTLSTTAMASSKYAKGDWVKLKRNARAYTAPKSSKITNSLAEKGSVALVVKDCGKYVKVKVARSKKSTKTTYFKKSDLKRLKNYDKELGILIYWVAGGDGMSKSTDWIDPYHEDKSKVMATGYTHLRRTNGLEYRSCGTVNKGEELDYLGEMGYDDRGVGWYKVSKNGKTMWISVHRASMPYGD